MWIGSCGWMSDVETTDAASFGWIFKLMAANVVEIMQDWR
jgi:hypothetical protein